MLTRVHATALAVFATLALSAGPAAAGFLRPATVFIVHGIPGENDAPVDVLVRGPFGIRGCLPHLTFANVVGPFWVPDGDYAIVVSRHTPGQPCSGEPIFGPRPLTLEPGEDTALALYLTEDAQPTFGKFDVNLRPGGLGHARVNVFHLAAAPAVDILISRGTFDRCGDPFLTIPDVGNGDFGSISLRPGDYSIAITPAGQLVPVLGPVPITLRPDVAYLLFAVGSRADGSLAVARAHTPTQPR